MKKICMFISVAMLCAVFSFANTGENNSNYIYLSESMKSEIARINEGKAARRAWNEVDPPGAKVMTMRVVLTPEEKKQAEKNAEEKAEKFNKIYETELSEINAEQSPEVIESKLNDAFSVFMNRNKEHQNDYYKIMANYLLEFIEVEALREREISFIDGKEFAEKFKEHEVYELYSDKDNKTKKRGLALSNIKLVILYNEYWPEVIISSQNPEEFQVYKWQHSGAVFRQKKNRFNYEKVSPYGNPYRELLKKVLSRSVLKFQSTK